MERLTAILFSIFAAAPVWANPTYNIGVVNLPLQKWHFQHLMASVYDNATRAIVRLTESHSCSLTHGHVDVAAFSPKGERIAETTPDYSPLILTTKTKRKGGVRLSSDFIEPLPYDSVMKIAFHLDEPVSKSNPIHAGNFAF